LIFNDNSHNEDKVCSAKYWTSWSSSFDNDPI